MAERLTDMEAQLLGMDKPEVTGLLGDPVKRGWWKTVALPADATPADVAAHEAGKLDEIWIYTQGRVHFSLAGKVIKVDDKTALDLPRDQMIV